MNLINHITNNSIKLYKQKTYLKIDMAIRQPIDTSFIQEVDVFDEQAEEWDNNLMEKQKEGEHILFKML